MANYDNGLSPITKSEGKISVISLDKTIYREEDAKRNIISITLDKSNISADLDESRNIMSISLEKSNISADLDESRNIMSISLEKASVPALFSWKIESICVDKMNMGICLGEFL